jgi:alpha-galactosidase
MSIYYNKKDSVFHLKTKSTSYLFRLIQPGYLQHVYWGKRLEEIGQNFFLRYHDPVLMGPDFNSDEFAPDVLPQEYPSYGSSDLRAPAFQVQLEDGSTVADLKFQGYRIFDGKEALPGLPACYTENDSEAQTLEITLVDELSGLEITLSYTAYEEYDVITRSVRFANRSDRKMKILRILSAAVDFSGSDFDLLQLSGDICNERNIIRRPLVEGGQCVESRRGASSAQQNPFIALLSKNADEEQGEAFGFSFVYSGNFLADVEVDQYGITRAQIGLNPFDFSWLLKPGETFQAPEAVLVYSNQGLGKMSRIYHRLYRDRLCRGKFRDCVRPVLINTWEAVHFNVTAEKIMETAARAKELGIELVVLDDGWFGHRNNDRSSLGDWYANAEKFPEGLGKLASDVRKLGLGFGLWFEPEMVSPDSDLYRQHPDWCIHVTGRRRSLGRHQLVLDLSRKEVCDAIVEKVSTVLSSAPISYVKWDMNRDLTEIGSASLEPERQRETGHRYILGLYEILDRLTKAFPDILFEGCASGGDRFDPGMLYYMPQTWTSDNTDARDRLRIQYGTSMVYPAVSITAHVTNTPNYLTRRSASMETRGFAAMSANLGYELDLTAISQEDQSEIRKQIDTYKQIRRIIQFGDLYRLLSPFEGDTAAWVFVSEDQEEAVAFYFQTSCCKNRFIYRPDLTLRLQGLSAQKKYRICGTEEVYGGDELLHAGLMIPRRAGDFYGCMWHLICTEKDGKNGTD